MAIAAPLTFGQLLRRYRMAAGLTQEALAMRASVSARSISDLERGLRRVPYQDTMERLAQALELAAPERAAFTMAAGRQGAGFLTTSRPGSSILPKGTPAPFVGRRRELALLDCHVAGEGPPVLVLSGEPGIGKSRLLAEAGERAREGGWRVLEGGCTRRSGQEPYAPVLEALERYITRQPPMRQRAELLGCAWLVRLLPELADGGVVPAPSWTLPDEQERRLMFAAVSRFLVNVAGPSGTLLLLDDLQWAGADALDLLRALTRSEAEQPIRILGAYRNTEVRAGDALAGALADLAREGLAALADIHPLESAEAAELLRVALGRVAGAGNEELAERVLQRTGGVPFYLLSCAQALRGWRPGQMSDERAADALPSDVLPWDVAHTIRQRVAALPESSQELLRLAAVVGRSVPGALLAQVTCWPDDEVLTALKAASHSALLVEVTDDLYRFAHDLIREVVEADLDGRQRKVLHRRVAEALEGEAGRLRSELLAFHYLRSGQSDKAIPYLEQAGDRARGLCANGEAEGYYREQLARLDELGRAAETAPVCEKLGAVLSTMARYPQALAVLEQALETYRLAADLEGQGRVMAQIGWVHASGGTPKEGLVRLQPALASLKARGLSAGGLAALHVAWAQLLYYTGRYTEQLEAAERGAEEARVAGDEQLLTVAEGRHGLALLVLGRAEEAMAVLETALELAERLGDLDSECRALHNLSWVHDTRGEYHRARAYDERALEITQRVGDPADIAYALYRCGLTAFFGGDWGQARECFGRAASVIGEVGMSSAFAYVLHGVGQMRLAEGHWEAATAALDEAIALAGRSANLQNARAAQNALAERDLLEGRPEAARERLEPLLDSRGRQETDVTFLLPRLAWAYLDLGEERRAQEVLAQSVARATAGCNRLALLDTLRVQAQAATRQGDWGAAICALEQGLALSRAMPCPYGEAKALYIYGLMHAAKGELPQARERLEAAHVMCSRLGERLYAEHIEQALQALTRR